jgi:hypothetical protein
MRKYIIMGAFTVVAIIVMAVLPIFGIHWQGFLDRQVEEQRYQTQKTSTSYRDGMKRNLDNIMRDYSNADSAGKQAMMSMIQHQYSEIDTSDFPNYQQDFLRSVGIY